MVSIGHESRPSRYSGDNTRSRLRLALAVRLEHEPTGEAPYAAVRDIWPASAVTRRCGHSCIAAKVSRVPPRPEHRAAIGQSRRRHARNFRLRALAAGDGRQDRNFVGIAHRVRWFGGLTIEPHPAMREESFEIRAEAFHRVGKDIRNGRSFNRRPFRTCSLTSLSEQQQRGHPSNGTCFARYATGPRPDCRPRSFCGFGAVGWFWRPRRTLAAQKCAKPTNDASADRSLVSSRQLAAR